MTESIAHIKSARPKEAMQDTTPPEAGNVCFLDDEPDDDTPLTWAEQLAVNVMYLIGAVVTVATVAMAIGAVSGCLS